MNTASRLLAALAAPGLAISGCATTPAQDQQIAQITANVAAITVKACGFVPLASSIGAILAANNAALATAEAIASAICASVAVIPAPVVASFHRKKLTPRRLPVIIIDGKPIVIQGAYASK